MERPEQEIPGERDGSRLLVDSSSFLYYKNGERGFRCRKYHSNLHCSGRLNLQEDGQYVFAGLHNHPNEANEIIHIQITAECRRRAATKLTPPKEIFNEVRRLYPDIDIGFNTAIERTMQRCRRSNQPSIPHSFDEVERSLQQHEMYRKTLDGGADFYSARVTTATRGSAFIFLSLALLPLLRESEELHTDGTFGTVPVLFYQLFTLHVMAYGKLFLVAFVLMSVKTANLYGLVLRYIMNTLYGIAPGEVAVRLMVSDFEEAFLGTMEAIFPNGRSRGCWFHYGQAIYRRACHEGLKLAYESRPPVRKLIKVLIALALLCPEHALEGFNVSDPNSKNCDCSFFLQSHYPGICLAAAATVVVERQPVFLEPAWVPEDSALEVLMVLFEAQLARRRGRPARHQAVILAPEPQPLHAELAEVAEDHPFEALVVPAIFPDYLPAAELADPLIDRRLICKICLTNPFDRALVPCGHTFCPECCDYRHITRCFICRVQVQFAMPIFIP